MMNFKLNLGIWGRLVLIFSLVSAGIVLGGLRVWWIASDVMASSEEQAVFFAAVETLDKIQEAFVDANLVGMDIIVDHNENPKAPVTRDVDFNELVRKSATDRNKWSERMDAIGEAVAFKTILDNLNKIHQGVQELIQAINKGEQRPEEFARFDALIDSGKEQGLAAIQLIRKPVEENFTSASEKAQQKLKLLIQTVTFAFIGCIALLFGFGIPVSASLSRSILSIQQQLAEIAKKMADMSSATNSTSQSLAESSTQGAVAIQESVSAMTEMNAMLTQTTRNSEATTELARDVLSQTESGMQVMGDMSRSMKAISESSSRLKEIAHVIENISAKTNVINDVVFKTQLLAVNASIEAARAGHHGRGFAVVANEVASLATLSGKASSEIRELLRTSSARVLEIIEGTAAAIHDGETCSERSTQSFGEIAQAVSSISERLEEISIASREQEVGVAQSSAAMAQMNQATAATSAMAQKNAQLAKEMSQQAHYLLSIDRVMRSIVRGSSEENFAKKILTLSLTTSKKPETDQTNMAMVKEQDYKQSHTKKAA